MEKRKEAGQLNGWQKKIVSTIVKSLRSKKDDDETLIELGKRKLDLSPVQYSYYRKKAMFLLKSKKLKNRG